MVFMELGNSGWKGSVTPLRCWTKVWPEVWVIWSQCQCNDWVFISQGKKQEAALFALLFQRRGERAVGVMLIGCCIYDLTCIWIETLKKANYVSCVSCCRFWNLEPPKQHFTGRPALSPQCWMFLDFFDENSSLSITFKKHELSSYGARENPSQHKRGEGVDSNPGHERLCKTLVGTTHATKTMSQLFGLPIMSTIMSL